MADEPIVGYKVVYFMDTGTQPTPEPAVSSMKFTDPEKAALYADGLLSKHDIVVKAQVWPMTERQMGLSDSHLRRRASERDG